MKKTIIEDWAFSVTVIKQNPCRMGFEIGDTFHCMYECPTGFCPKTMANLHSLCEVARAAGDYTCWVEKLNMKLSSHVPMELFSFS